MAIIDNEQGKEFNVVLFGVKEVAELLSVTPRTIMNYIKDGRLRAVKIGGRWRISKDNLKAFCEGEINN